MDSVKANKTGEEYSAFPSPCNAEAFFFNADAKHMTNQVSIYDTCTPPKYRPLAPADILCACMCIAYRMHTD